MIRRARRARQLWQHFGPGWLAYRVAYRLQTRTGLLRRRLPATAWTEQPLAAALRDRQLADAAAYLRYRRFDAPHFFFSAADKERYGSLLRAWDTPSVSPVVVADRLLQGRLRYFEHREAAVGFPPPWFTNPFTGQSAPSAPHWTAIDDFGFGDIKVIWEPSRFGFAYALVRAYWRTGDERYVEGFWKAVEDWKLHNPPQQGPNWKCGQETTFRVMAWCFALYGFLDSPATTAERVVSLAQLIMVSGKRIEGNLAYALSQRNNHGISEGLGLWTIGTLFPELADAARWRERGRAVLEAQGRELIYDDGSFAQHSVNYHRLMLHDYLWVFRLAELGGEPFSPRLYARVRQAAEWLYQLHDEASGGAPCYGHNDGALILPLNNCDYQDVRPVVAAVQYLTERNRSTVPGPWDEDLLWLFGAPALETLTVPSHQHDWRADDGGYYTIRSHSSFALVRCATFRDRPSQADMLHLDLWWRGQNVVMDAGSFSYHAPPPWNNALAHSAYHNTVTVDGADQMDRAGPFLWLPWIRSRVVAFRRSAAGNIAYWQGQHDGYRRLVDPVEHRRSIVRVGDDVWIVVDRLVGRVPHRYCLHWLLADVPSTWSATTGDLALHTPLGRWAVRPLVLSGAGSYSLVRADESSPRGWRAPYYNDREPALSLAVETQSRSAFFVTVLAPGSCTIDTAATALTLAGETWRAVIEFAQSEASLLVAKISLMGAIEDELELT